MWYVVKIIFFSNVILFVFGKPIQNVHMIENKQTNKQKQRYSKAILTFFSQERQKDGNILYHIVYRHRFALLTDRPIALLILQSLSIYRGRFLFLKLLVYAEHAEESNEWMV